MLLDPGVKAGLTDPDDVPAPPDEAITQPGDLWVMGDHRLLCGDSSSAVDVDRLLDGQSIHLVNTDPPYNVKVEPRSNSAIAAGLSSFGEHGLMHHQSFDAHRAAKRTRSRYHGMDVATGAQTGKATHRKLRPKDRVRGAFEAALDTMRNAGATLVDIGLPHAKYAIPVYYLVATAEASSNLARYDGVRYGHRSSHDKEQGLKAMYSRTRDEGFGAEVKRRIMLGTYVLSAGYYDAFYLKAQQVRTLLRNDYQKAFEKVDVVAMPTSPIPPFRLGEKTDDPLQMYLADVFTVSAPLAGLPAISTPCGFVERSERSERLPVGLQLTGRMFDESMLLRVADAFERTTDWHTQTPPPI